VQTIVLTKSQIEEVVFENKYRYNDKSRLLSRCIDDRYQDELDLSPLAIPGADAGQLAILYATANSYGFEIIEEKAYWVLSEVVGGVSNLHFHTDKKNENDPIAGCGHVRELQHEPQSYSLTKEQAEFIKIKVKNSLLMEAEDKVVTGKHLAGAVIQIKGNHSIYPAAYLETEEGKKRVEFFVLHQTLINERHKIIARKLIENKAVTLFPGCDMEYLYEAISDIAEQHFLETIKRLAKGLPLYRVNFNTDGSFKVVEQGNV